MVSRITEEMAPHRRGGLEANEEQRKNCGDSAPCNFRWGNRRKSGDKPPIFVHVKRLFWSSVYLILAGLLARIFFCELHASWALASKRGLRSVFHGTALGYGIYFVHVWAVSAVVEDLRATACAKNGLVFEDSKIAKLNCETILWSKTLSPSHPPLNPSYREASLHYYQTLFC